MRHGSGSKDGQTGTFSLDFENYSDKLPIWSMLLFLFNAEVCQMVQKRHFAETTCVVSSAIS